MMLRGQSWATATDRPRIGVVAEQANGVLSPCASIRVEPFLARFLTQGRALVRYLQPIEIERAAPDILVWHRVSLPTAQQVEGVCNVAAKCGAYCIYDLDDNLLQMEDHPERAAYQGYSEAVRRSIECADEVWCSTPALVSKVTGCRSGAVVLMPNALDPELWQTHEPPKRAKPHSGPLQILYMGTRTHQADFELIAAALERIDQATPGAFCLTVIGVLDDRSARFSWLRTLDPDAHAERSYPAFAHWLTSLPPFDIGIAPLRSSPFNDCKSPIKAMDYAAIGLATLASAVPAYQHALVPGLDCVLVENSADAWMRAVEVARENPTDLWTIARTARRLVHPSVFHRAVEDRWRRCALAGARGTRKATAER